MRRIVTAASTPTSERARQFPPRGAVARAGHGDVSRRGGSRGVVRAHPLKERLMTTDAAFAMQALSRGGSIHGEPDCDVAIAYDGLGAEYEVWTYPDDSVLAIKGGSSWPVREKYRAYRGWPKALRRAA